MNKRLVTLQPQNQLTTKIFKAHNESTVGATKIKTEQTEEAAFFWIAEYISDLSVWVTNTIKLNYCW